MVWDLVLASCGDRCWPRVDTLQVDFEAVHFKIPRGPRSSEGPLVPTVHRVSPEPWRLVVLSRLCPHSIDIRRSHQSGGAGRNHVQARVCLRRFLHQRGPAHVHVFLWLRGGVRGHSALRDGFFPEVCHRFYFLKYVITDALNYGSAPDPLRGSRGDGHVASSLCTSLLPAQRARPGRLVHVAQTGARSSQRSVFNFNVSPG